MSDFLREQALENLKKYFNSPKVPIIEEEPKPSIFCQRCGETVSVFYWPLTVGANEVHICDRCFKSFREWWDTPHRG